MTQAAINAPTAQAKPVLKGVSVLLYGDAGTGKTTSIGTLADAGLRIVYVGVEPGIESMISYWVDRDLPVPENVHWQYIQPSAVGFSDMAKAAENVLKLPRDALFKLTDANKSKHDRFNKFLTAMNNFVDDRTGQSLGAVDKFGTDTVLVIDSMTSLNAAAVAMTVGAKTQLDPGEWGTAMTSIERVMRQLTENCQCHLVVISHAARDKDEVTQVTKLMPDCLGNKLITKITPMFSDIIKTVKAGKDFYWDTADMNAIVKTRYLKIDNKLPPSFVPIIESWKKRSAAMAALKV